MIAFGYDYMATGHYVNIVSEKDIFYIQSGIDPEKDQSFFLWGLSQTQLSRVLFPLGNFTKSDVRKYMSDRNHIDLTYKKESTGACFLENRNYREFIKEQSTHNGIKINGGPFKTLDGIVVGTHHGFPFYTIGQRHGLGLISNEPLYVIEFRPQDNSILVGPKANLFKTKFYASEYVIHDSEIWQKEVDIRIRYRKQNNKGYVRKTDDQNIEITLTTPLDSIAPGQSVVFYIDNKVVGGAFIIKNPKNNYDSEN